MTRKKLGYIAVILTAVLSVPYALAILHQQVWLVLGLQFVITLTGVGILHGLAPILTSESFPTKYRYSGAGISYSLSAILGGGIAPPLLAGLIGQDVAGNWFYIPVVYGIYAVIAVAALALTPETRNRRLDEFAEAQDGQAGAGSKVACGAPT
jgi:MFS family permease